MDTRGGLLKGDRVREGGRKNKKIIKKYKIIKKGN